MIISEHNIRKYIYTKYDQLKYKIEKNIKYEKNKRTYNLESQKRESKLLICNLCNHVSN